MTYTLDISAIRARLDRWETLIAEQDRQDAAHHPDEWPFDDPARLIEEAITEAMLDLAHDVHPLMRANAQLTAERDRARDLAAALESELAAARASETRWLIRIAGQAVNAWRTAPLPRTAVDEYEGALLDVLGWWLDEHTPTPAEMTMFQLRRWAMRVTIGHERGDTIDERTLLKLWERAHE